MACLRFRRLSPIAISCLVLSTSVEPSWGEGTSPDSLDGGEATTSTTSSEDVDRQRRTAKDLSDGGQRASSSKKSEDPCAAEEARIQQRKSWLADRSDDQAKRGIPNAQRAIPNMAGVYCDEHPEDKECRLGQAPTSFEPDELSIDAQKTPEDRDPHVIGLKRDLETCRKRFR